MNKSCHRICFLYMHLCWRKAFIYFQRLATIGQMTWSSNPLNQWQRRIQIASRRVSKVLPWTHFTNVFPAHAKILWKFVLILLLKCWSIQVTFCTCHDSSVVTNCDLTVHQVNHYKNNKLWHFGKYFITSSAVFMAWSPGVNNRLSCLHYVYLHSLVM